MKRTIFFAILTFSFLVTSIFAQTINDKVLVQGNPALTHTMIDKSREVFEFTFGGALNESEKQIYQNHLIKQWKDNDTETIKSIRDLVDFYDKAAGLSKEKLIEVQKQLREPLVKDLRDQANTDSLAKMLIGAYDRIQGLNVKQGGNLPVPNGVRQQGDVQPPNGGINVRGGSIPKELLGEWVKSSTSNLLITNPGIGGGYGSPNGEKEIFHFYADGTYEAAYYVQSSMSYGCTMTVYMAATGGYRVQGNTLHLTEKTNRTISKDTCIARYNYEKDNKPGVRAYPAQLERDEYGIKLVLTMNDGKHNFYFNTGKSFLGKK
jgi:hypothetical protein